MLKPSKPRPPCRWTRVHTMMVACAILSLVTLLPIFVVALPPFHDLPFETARMHILMNPEAPHITDWFNFRSEYTPSLGMDIVVPLLGLSIGIAAATRVLICATFVLLMTGTLALHYALYKARSTWLPLVAALFIYNLVTFLGLFNFLFGVGFMLWGLALWFLALRRSLPVRILIGAVAAAIIYLCSLYALVLFAAVIGTAEFSLLYRDPQRQWQDITHSGAAVTIPLCLPILMLFLHGNWSLTTFYAPQDKLFAVLSPFLTDNLPVDLLVAVGVVVMLAVAWATGALTLSRRLRMFVIAVSVLSVILPTTVFGITYADMRLPVAAIFIALAGCRFHTHANPKVQIGLATAVIILFGVRMASLVVDFRIVDHEEAAITEQYRQFKSGSVVFAANLAAKTPLRSEDWKLLWARRPMLPPFEPIAVLYQNVFVPEMRAAAEPMRMVPVYAKLKSLLQSRDDARWLSDNDHLAEWLDDIRLTLQEPEYQFTAVYITLVDPAGIAQLPSDAIEVYNQGGYRIWDISSYVVSQQ